MIGWECVGESADEREYDEQNMVEVAKKQIMKMKWMISRIMMKWMMK